jgi:hypothetical protein
MSPNAGEGGGGGVAGSQPMSTAVHMKPPYLTYGIQGAWRRSCLCTASCTKKEGASPSATLLHTSIFSVKGIINNIILVLFARKILGMGFWASGRKTTAAKCVPLQIIYLDDSILHCLLKVLSFYDAIPYFSCFICLERKPV